jgi:hypothetical protein
MKRLFLAVLMLLTLCSVCVAGNYSYQVYPSTRLTADSAVLAAKGAWRDVLVLPDGTTTCTVKIYDNASAASGTVIWEHFIDTGSKDSKGVMLGFPIYVTNGIYVDITTTGRRY